MPRQPKWPVGPARSPRQQGRVLGAVLLVVLIGLGIFDWFAILHPHSDKPAKADVVVAIAGTNNPARFQLAQSLVKQGYASMLLTDIPTSPHDPDCARPGVTCFTPSPNTTQGEARVVAAMAKAHGWTSVLLVVSKDQAFRARIRFTRCYSGALRVLTVPIGDSKVYAVVYQDLALVKAEVWQRGC